MPLHLMKLCVGVDGVERLDEWIKDCRAGRDTLDHITRSFPRRAEEILPGGSLYWIIRGAILCRQPITTFEPVRGEDGIVRCRIVFKPKIVLVRPTPRRAFQGWRYLDAADAPPDMPRSAEGQELSSAMRQELAELGLL
jgi:hypothetical protein